MTSIAAPKQVTIAVAAAMLSYSRSKVYELIRAGVLKTTGKGSGLRVVLSSIDAYLAGGEAWQSEKPKQGVRLARARSGGTRKISVGSGASRSTAKSTPSPTLIDRGRKLDLKR